MQKLFVFIGLLLLVSCKPKQIVATENASDNVAVTKIIKGHYANEKDFKTLNIKVNAHYEDTKQSQNVTAEVRVSKNEKILVIVRFFGITMAKALITPDKVSYYEKINGKYFEGDYKLLSNWLGTDLDFQKVQNLFLGIALDDLTKESYIATVENNLHKLKSKTTSTTEKEFWFEEANFLLKRETLLQKSENRNLEINYTKHQETPNGILPAEINIQAQQKDKVIIQIGYNSVIHNEELSFSYDVPNGYEQIFID